MAENPKFNNIDMFKDVTTNTGHTDIDADNKSEVLATQGNVINSIKTFWNNLRKKLVYAITRTDTTNAVGGNYQPIFVNKDGGVQVCVPTTITGEVVQRNISLDEIASPYPGQIVCIKVTKTDTTSNNGTLTIKGKQVYYPTNVAVTVSDVIGNTYLFTYISGDGDKWILNNKINVVSTNNSGLMTADQCSKLADIAPNANNYILPTADDNTTGGVRLGYTTNGKNYSVQKDNNDKLYVNVPWTDNNTHNTAYLRAGDNSSTNNGSTGNTNTYLKIVDGGTLSSNLKIEGSGGTTISSNQGIITISSQEPYNPVNIDSSNNDPNSQYTVKGAGNNANTNYFLAGNGTWVKVTSVPNPPTGIDSDKTLKCRPNGTIYWG